MRQHAGEQLQILNAPCAFRPASAGSLANIVGTRHCLAKPVSGITYYSSGGILLVRDIRASPMGKNRECLLVAALLVLLTIIALPI